MEEGYRMVARLEVSLPARTAIRKDAGMGKTMGRVTAFKAIWKALTKSGGPSLGRRLGSLPRMFWYSVTGRYDGLGRLVLITVATAYVASPIDLVPELFLLIPGLIDDAVVVAWIAGAILSETERFLMWEQGRTMKPVQVIDGDVA